MKNTSKQLLRLSDEPCRHIGEMEVHDVLMAHCNPFMDELSRFYQQWPEGKEPIQLPVKQVFNQASCTGDFRVMPCVIEPLKLKMVKIIGTNEEQCRIKDKICVGKAALIDYWDNYIYALFDVCALSSFRTAAIACLAFSVTGLKSPRVTLVGAGRIGFYTATILHRWQGVSEVRVYDPDPENLDRFCALCARYVPALKLTMMDDLSALGRDEALFLATTAQEPICTATNCQGIRFISSVGADADNLSELDSSLLSSHDLVTDSIQSMCLGDMKRWQSGGQLSTEKVTELKDVVQRPLRDDEKRVFISTGVALQDALVCHFIYDKL